MLVYFVKKIVIDACHSGGFWKGTDPAEAGRVSLESVPDTALFAAAPEKDLMYFSKYSGWGFYSRGLLDELISGVFFNASALDAATGLDQLAKYYAAFEGQSVDPFFAEGEFGDLVPADPNLVSSFFASNVDHSTQDVEVPEPSSLPLVLQAFAAALLFGYRRIGAVH